MLPDHITDVPGIVDESSFTHNDCPVNHHHHHTEKNLVGQAGELNLVHMKKAFTVRLQEIQEQHQQLLEKKIKK